MIDASSIALLGVGFGAEMMAMFGYLPEANAATYSGGDDGREERARKQHVARNNQTIIAFVTAWIGSFDE